MFTTNSDKLILLNLNDGKVLFEQNANESAAVASLTKIMTAILTLENRNKSDTVTITAKNARRTK
jgi:serine-type D-Ala-D-Ala carboxypeptidase (penicillin-binding protein 5/6)